MSMVVDTSGCVHRRSHHHQRASTTAAVTAQPIVRAEVQPHGLPPVIPSSSNDNPTARPAAPIQSTVPVALCGRFGTTIMTAMVTTATNADTNQNARW